MELTFLDSMQSLCKNHLQQLFRIIDGAAVSSQNERNLDCIFAFQTRSILQHFILRFNFLQLDCNDHLYVYNSPNAIGKYIFDLSCRSTERTLTNLTDTNFVTLKYVTGGGSTNASGFELVITGVKDPKYSCNGFRCREQEFCISNDLICDGISHCLDGSDEFSNSSNTLCSKI